MYMRKANRVTLLESEIEEIRNVFAKYSDDQEGYDFFLTAMYNIL